MGEKIRAKVFISGKVQGVFFRDSAQKKAVSLGLSGWVRNLDDGRVEVLFQGESERVRDMILWVHKGPEFAIVDDTNIIFEDYKEDFDNFEVR
ncbi:MAG: acylphosphatase [Patescibacteria group bacterium]|nr:acylphosphatase [Patescibacteria group bacterium]